jgi:predicted metal-dependent enzyme (double-stranded beta helix superfamily)
MALDKERFIADLQSVIHVPAPTKAVREIVRRAVADPAGLLEAFGAPARAGIQRLHVSEELTVLNVVWGPYMTLMPHNHNMWATIGVYGGREDNIFWRRLPDPATSRIEAAGAKSLGPGDVRPLGAEIIHSVTNPTSKLTGAIHVYGGNFFTTERSQWDPEKLEERPYDIDRNVRLFADSNRLLELNEGLRR